MKATAEEKLDGLPARIRAAVDEVVEARAAEAAVLTAETQRAQRGQGMKGDRK